MIMETLYPYTYNISNSNWLVEESKITIWTKEDNKRFESALALYDKETSDRWLKVAAMTPGKSDIDVKRHYEELVADVYNIEAGLVPIPGYLTSEFTLEFVENRGFDPFRKRSVSVRSSDQERKKGVPWTEDEHRRFLLGLQQHGKGEWRNISRNFVISKTPTQVASHAQKYFIRQSSGGKDKRRPSIHDITTVNLNETTKMENDDSATMYTSNFLPPAQKSSSSPKILLDWNYSNDADVKVFNSTRGYPFVYDIGSRGGLKLQGHSHHMVPQNPAFHVQATRYHQIRGWGRNLFYVN